MSDKISERSLSYLSNLVDVDSWDVTKSIWQEMTDIESIENGINSGILDA